LRDLRESLDRIEKTISSTLDDAVGRDLASISNEFEFKRFQEKQGII
jgi:hypothetical protein